MKCWVAIPHQTCCCFQLIDLLVISYALVLLFHPEYAVVPPRYPDSYESNRHHSDVVPSSTVETDHAAVNLTAAVFSGNTSSSLRSICWTNCGLLCAFDCFLVVTV